MIPMGSSTPYSPPVTPTDAHSQSSVSSDSAVRHLGSEEIRDTGYIKELAQILSEPTTTIYTKTELIKEVIPKISNLQIRQSYLEETWVEFSGALGDDDHDNPTQYPTLFTLDANIKIVAEAFRQSANLNQNDGLSGTVLKTTAHAQPNADTLSVKDDPLEIYLDAKDEARSFKCQGVEECIETFRAFGMSLAHVDFYGVDTTLVFHLPPNAKAQSIALKRLQLCMGYTTGYMVLYSLLAKTNCLSSVKFDASIGNAEGESVAGYIIKAALDQRLALKKMTIGKDEIGNHSVLCQELQESTSLTTFCLDQTYLNESEFISLMAALFANKSLTDIRVKGMKINTEDLDQMYEVLKNNVSLRRIELDLPGKDVPGSGPMTTVKLNETKLIDALRCQGTLCELKIDIRYHREGYFWPDRLNVPLSESVQRHLLANERPLFRNQLNLPKELVLCASGIPTEVLQIIEDFNTLMRILSGVADNIPKNERLVAGKVIY